MVSRIIAVTGGIGCGKSVICKILEVKGFRVYDCDSRAKRVMDSSPDIIRKIKEKVSSHAVLDDGTLDRKSLAKTVFSDPKKLAALNQIVHGAVISDLKQWIKRQADCKPIFFETAILYQSGLQVIASEVWDVTAPTEIRIQRVCRRDKINESAVIARINAQRYDAKTPHPCVSTIINDGVTPLLPQVNALLSNLR